MNEIEKVKSVVSYDPDTGIFRWISDRNSKIKAGQIAGHTRKRCGYTKIIIFGKYYAAHRLAWMFVYGYWPSVIDHIDRNRSNNAICNLRESTASQNAMNRSANIGNRSGYKGVTWHKPSGKWQAQAGVGRKNHYLGLFDSAEDASAAYEKFCSEHHGDFYLKRQNQAHQEAAQ